LGIAFSTLREIYSNFRFRLPISLTISLPFPFLFLFAVVTASGWLAIKNFANFVAFGWVPFFFGFAPDFWKYFHMEEFLVPHAQKSPGAFRILRVISISVAVIRLQIAKLKLNVTK